MSGFKEQPEKQVLHGRFTPKEKKEIEETGYSIAVFTFLNEAGLVSNIQEFQSFVGQRDFKQFLEDIKHEKIKEALKSLKEGHSKDKEN